MRVALSAAVITVGASIAHAACPYLDGGTIEHNVPLGCPLRFFYPADAAVSPPSTITVARGGQLVELTVTGSTAIARVTLDVTLDRPDPATCSYESYKEPRELDGFALDVDGLLVGDQFSTSIIGEPAACLESTMASGFEQWLYCASPSDPYVQCCESMGMPADCYRPVGQYPGTSCGDCSSSSSTSLGVAVALLALRKRKRRSS